MRGRVKYVVYVISIAYKLAHRPVGRSLTKMNKKMVVMKSWFCQFSYLALTVRYSNAGVFVYKYHSGNALKAFKSKVWMLLHYSPTCDIPVYICSCVCNIYMYIYIYVNISRENRWNF